MSVRRSREAEIALVRPSQPRPTHRSVAGAAERRLPGAMEVPIEQVVADPGQPRQDWSYNDGARRLSELADSVREFGVLQPLVVREEGTIRDGRQRYIIISGARRRAAAERAGLASLPVVVRGEESSRVRALQLVENLQRQELSPLDEARAYQELIDLEGLTPPGLAARLHISPQHVRDRLRVLADQVLADAVERRQIAPSAARDIMKLPDEQMEVFRGRVQAGERVQLSDVAEARARLAAAGVVNPRRKIARDSMGAGSIHPGTPESAGTNRASKGTTDGAVETGTADGGSPAVRAGLQGPASVETKDGNDVGAQAEQTVFVSGIGQLPYRGSASGVGSSEQTVFVNGSNEDGRSSSVDPVVPADLVRSIERFVTVLNDSLRGDLRVEMADLLTGPNSDQLWALTLPRLRALLAHP